MTKHYDVPLVSLRAGLLDSVRRGDHSALNSLHKFMLDCKHPTGQGHTYMAQMVLSRLWAARDLGAGERWDASGERLTLAPCFV